MRVTLYIKPRSYDKLFKGKIAEWQERYMDMIYNLLREDVITRNDLEGFSNDLKEKVYLLLQRY